MTLPVDGRTDPAAPPIVTVNDDVTPRNDAKPERRVLVLAHELQHVREVIESGIEPDEASLTALFERIGSRLLGSSSGELYETHAAQQVMGAVQREPGSAR